MKKIWNGHETKPAKFRSQRSRGAWLSYWQKNWPGKLLLFYYLFNNNNYYLFIIIIIN